MRKIYLKDLDGVERLERVKNNKTLTDIFYDYMLQERADESYYIYKEIMDDVEPRRYNTDQHYDKTYISVKDWEESYHFIQEIKSAPARDYGMDELADMIDEAQAYIKKYEPDDLYGMDYKDDEAHDEARELIDGRASRIALKLADDLYELEQVGQDDIDVLIMDEYGAEMIADVYYDADDEPNHSEPIYYRDHVQV